MADTNALKNRALQRQRSDCVSDHDARLKPGFHATQCTQSNERNTQRTHSFLQVCSIEQQEIDNST